MIIEEITVKKTLLFAAAALALSACSKETPVKEEGAIDASRIVFNIDVQNADAQATKGIKTAWEAGDDVYVFFEDNTTKYVKMTYDGSAWTYNVLGDGDLSLAASGKKLSAVYMPDFVCSATPTYDTDKWTFGSVGGYYQKAEGASYTVTSAEDVTTLNATISLTAPSNIMQFYVPKDAVTAPGTGNEYVLTATHVVNYIFNGIAPGGAASQGNISKGFPMTANYGTVGGDEGYYFWGILEGTGTYTYDFQLVKRNAEKKYAISSYSASKAPGVEITSAAFKLDALTYKGSFVSLGYAGGPLWATGNIDKTNGKIVDPLEAGEYFRYGKTTPYSSSESNYTGMEDPLSTSADVAYSVNTSWRIPTKAQFDALISASNTETVWKTGWTTLGGNNGGRLITSKVNGISLFFAATGYYYDGSLYFAGDEGDIWSSTPRYSIGAYSLTISSGVGTSGDYRGSGYSVRPVQN